MYSAYQTERQREWNKIMEETSISRNVPSLREGWLQCRINPDEQNTTPIYEDFWCVLNNEGFWMYSGPNDSQVVLAVGLHSAELIENPNRGNPRSPSHHGFAIYCHSSKKLLELKAASVKERAIWLSALTSFMKSQSAKVIKFNDETNTTGQNAYHTLPLKNKLSRTQHHNNRISLHIGLLSQKSNQVKRRKTLREIVKEGINQNKVLLWNELPEVISSGILGKLSQAEIKLETLRFRLITSEVEYNYELTELVHLAKRSVSWDDTLPVYNRRTIASTIERVKKCSDKVVYDLEQLWQKKLQFENLYILLQDHSDIFDIYVTYSNHLQEFSDVLNRVSKQKSDTANPIFSSRYNMECVFLPLFRMKAMVQMLADMYPILKESNYRLGLFHCNRALSQLKHIFANCYKFLSSTAREELIETFERRAEVTYSDYIKVSFPITSHNSTTKSSELPKKLPNAFLKISSTKFPLQGEHSSVIKNKIGSGHEDMGSSTNTSRSNDKSFSIENTPYHRNYKFLSHGKEEKAKNCTFKDISLLKANSQHDKRRKNVKTKPCTDISNVPDTQEHPTISNCDFSSEINNDNTCMAVQHTTSNLEYTKEIKSVTSLDNTHQVDYKHNGNLQCCNNEALHNTEISFICCNTSDNETISSEEPSESCENNFNNCETGKIQPINQYNENITKMSCGHDLHENTEDKSKSDMLIDETDSETLSEIFLSNERHKCCTSEDDDDQKCGSEEIDTIQDIQTNDIFVDQNLSSSSTPMEAYNTTVFTIDAEYPTTYHNNSSVVMKINASEEIQDYIHGKLTKPTRGIERDCQGTSQWNSLNHSSEDFSASPLTPSTRTHNEIERSASNASISLQNIKKWCKPNNTLHENPTVGCNEDYDYVDLPQLYEAPLYQEYCMVDQPELIDDGTNVRFSNTVELPEHFYEPLDDYLVDQNTMNNFHVFDKETSILKSDNRRVQWCEIKEVIESGLLDNMSLTQRNLQEAKFEIMTSEWSFLKSLTILEEYFEKNPELQNNNILQEKDRQKLFISVAPVKEVSQTFLKALVELWEKDILLNELSQLILQFATGKFRVYIGYCCNQVFTNDVLDQLREKNRKFVEIVEKIERNPACQLFSLQSFLMQPTQRITRLPILVEAILKYLPPEDKYYNQWKKVHTILQRVVNECNEAVRRSERSLIDKRTESSKFKYLWQRFQGKK